VGHWADTCPERLSAQRRGPVPTKNTASVASLSTIPMLEEGEALLDSGATHLVVGSSSLFTNLKATDMILSVASRHKFPVDGVGDVVLNTPGGALEL
ncbi:hypothetical protein O181_133179, partial [Austropuccinia psidii MF-1]|nr:hypothetical protein [Austropuccinia psidii MF-1]